MFVTLAARKLSKEILRVKTGGEAVKACRNNPDIDLILMDIKMPDMDGHEATMQIRQFNTDVVIIAQTAYAQSGDRERALAAGCNEYISKPFNKDIMALMKKYFKNRKMNTKPGSINSHGAASIIIDPDGTPIIRS